MDFKTLKNKPLVIGISFVLIYYIAARGSLTLAFENSNATPIWPPSGLAIALIFLYGKRYLGAIFIGAFFTNSVTLLAHNSPNSALFLSSIFIALGNTLEALIAYQFYQLATDGKKPLKNTMTFLIFIAVSIAACFAAAFIGTLVLWQAGYLSAAHYNTVLITWWLGDFIGIITLGSLLIALGQNKRTKGNSFEYLITLVSLAICTIVIFTHFDSQSFISQIHFILLPIFLWISLRFNLQKTLLAINLMAILAILGTAHGYGPFQEGTINHSLLLVQFFLGIITITFALFNLKINESTEVEPNKSKHSHQTRAQWFSLLAFALSIVTSIIIVNQKHQSQKQVTTRLIEQQLTVINKRLTHKFLDTSESLQRLADRQTETSSQETWKRDATAYLKDFQSIIKLNYVNSVQKTLFQEQSSKDFSESSYPDLMKMKKHHFEISKRTLKTSISPPIKLKDNLSTIIFVIPRVLNEQFKGCVIAFCIFDQFMEPILEVHKKNYDFNMLINDHIIIKSPSNQLKNSQQTQNSQIHDFSWSLSIRPKNAMLHRLQQNDWPFQIILGLILSVLMSTTVYLSINSGSRTNELKRLNNNLSRKNTELIKQKIAARQAAQAKDSFLTNMSHEIRTPMNGVLGALQLAKECDPDELQQYLRVIDVSAKSLMGIIDEVLDYSNLESGEIAIETDSFNLSHFISNSVKIIESATTLKGIKLEFHISDDLPKYIMGDPVRLKQIMVNLLSNALKFTHEGKIEVIVNRDFNDMLKIEIKDTGCGIPEHMKKAIFNHFEQLDQTSTRGAGGTGLGLSICRTLVNMMAGSINVVSKVDEGSNFILKIPLIVGKRPKTIAHLNELQLLSKKVLVCEDDSANSLIIRKILERMGLKTISAMDGQEALDILQKDWQQIDLVFMDIEMPKHNGIEVATQIHQNIPLFNVPIIALTANNTEQDREKCQAAGMKGFLIKPINKKKLQSQLNQWLQS
jgi:signal transduction histidine kinase/integral membrane sensor domain MASE1